MMTALRVFFLSRVLREKLLLVAFIAIGAAIWLSSFSGRAGVFLKKMSDTTGQLKDQKEWIGRSAVVEAEAQKAAAKLVKAETLDRTSLFTTVQALAREAGVPFSGTPGPPPNPNDQFTFNTLRVTSDLRDPDAKKNWDAVIKFYTLLQQRSPYIVIEKFAVQAARNPSQLNMVISVSALRIH
jgi:hypothetical protein